MKNFKTIREVASLWRKEKQLYVKQSTLFAYVLIIENHIVPALGNKRALTEEDVQEFVLQKLQNGLSQKTVKGILVVLKMIQKLLELYFFAKKMANEDASLLSYERLFVKFYLRKNHKKIDNQRKIMEYVINNFSFRNLGVYISLSTGMRIGEICALKWSDINLKRESISVNRTIERIYIVKDGKRHTELVMGTPKTKNSIREIPIDCELLKLISVYATKANQDHFVLTNKTKPTEPRTYRNYYKKLLKQLNIPNLKFHGLRHSFATRCIESQCDYKTVSVILGHANISTTLNLYVHPNMEQKRKCINKMFESLK